MGAVNTTYTFTATDTITSTKMNNIIDETVMTSDAVLGGSGGSGGLDISSGKLSISANAINSSRLAANSVTSTNIVDGTIVNADISPTAAIAGTKIVSSFGTQDISATGDLWLAGTVSDYTKATLQNTSGVQTQFFANGNTDSGLLTTSNHPLSLGTNNTERMRITAAGNIGIGTSTPQTKLQVAGGAIRVEAHAGEGGQIELLNASNNDIQAIFDVDPNDLTRIWTLPNEPLSFGTNSGEKMRISANGNVGIGTTSPASKLDVNGTVTATAFAGQLFGQADSALTASTVSNGAITAAKLDGSQSGSAPIFGARAWVNFNGSPATPTITGQGNVSSVSKSGTGTYTVNLTTALSDTNYAIVGFARDANTSPGNYFVSAISNGTKTTSSFAIRVYSQGGALVDSPEINIMVMR